MQRFPRALRRLAAIGLTTTLAALAAAFVALPAAAESADGVAVSPDPVVVGGDVTVQFSNAGATADDWIAIGSSATAASECPSGSGWWQYTSSGTTTAGSTAVASGSLTFSTAGKAAGTYWVYYCADGGYAEIGSPVRLTIAAPISTATPSIVLGQTIAFDYADPVGESSKKNWIGVYAGSTCLGTASVYWKYTSSGTQTAGASPVASGSIAFDTSSTDSHNGSTATPWAVGTYTACLNYNDLSPNAGNANGGLLGSVTFTITEAAPVVTLSASSLTAGSPLTVTVAVPSGKTSAANWIGVYDAGVIPAGSQSSHDRAWQYLNSGTQTAGSEAASSATLTFADLPSGAFTVYLLYDDGYTVLGSAALTVVSVISTATPTIELGQTIAFDYNDPAGKSSTKNWIGVYEGGDCLAHASEYWYYTGSGTQTASSTVKRSGTMTFDTSSAAGQNGSGGGPWGAGTYTACLNYNDLSPNAGNANGGMLGSVTFTITSTTPAVAAAGFVTDTFKLPGVATSATISQPIAGLWGGATPTSYTKVSGDDWLSVDANGVVTGTAPSSAPVDAGEIVVRATNGSQTAQLLVEVPVNPAPAVQAATWNAWAGGANVTDAASKAVALIAARGVGVIGFQDGGGAMAEAVAAALGWHVVTSGELGIVSAYPIDGDGVVTPTAAAPALAATLAVHGSALRVWDVYLDESAAAAGRDAQAQAVAESLRPDVAAADTTPVVVLGDLGDADRLGAFTDGGLADAFATAHPGSTITTYPVFPSESATASEIDHVLVAGAAIHLLGADRLSAGWPSATSPADNTWPSDHAAVVATLSLGGTPTTPGARPTVNAVDGIAYQAGNGPADASAFLAAVGATASPSGVAPSADLIGVDFAATGWYTAGVSATDPTTGATANTVFVAVHVVPVVVLTLGSADDVLHQGEALTASGVYDALQPSLNVAGDISIDLAQVDPARAGTYPIVVTGTDAEGFTATQTAMLTVERPATVAFDANQGTGSIPSQTAAFGVATSLTANAGAISRTGYAFAGWNTKADGTGTAYGDGDTYGFTADATLYARWTPLSYTVVYDPNASDATGTTPPAVLDYDTDAVLAASGYQRAGFRFAGWATTPSGPVVHLPGAVVRNLAATDGATVTLFAVWVAPVVDRAPASARAGEAVSVAGSGFAPGEPVQVVLHSDPVLLATLTADGRGSVAGTVTIPAGTPAGTHHLELRGAVSGASVTSAAIEIAAAAPLASTGTDPLGGLVVAGLLLGAALLAVGVRLALRRRAAAR